MSGPIPEWLLTVTAAATVFAVMFASGLGIVLREFRWAWEHPGLLAKGLFAVVIAVPAMALLVVRVFDLARPVEIGIVLMAIAPGAPVALRRSLVAGGHHAFAPALQILVALLAVVSMPLSLAVLTEMYEGHASIAPLELARQVFIAQLLPLSLGMLVRRTLPIPAAWLERRLVRVSAVLLIVLAGMVLIDIRHVLVDAGPPLVLAIVIVTALALAVGHWLGGPDAGTRTSVSISSAARNAGLALLVATLNNASPVIIATVLAYLVVSAFTVIPYALWRGRSTLRSAH